jgi:hypothetical protein
MVSTVKDRIEKNAKSRLELLAKLQDHVTDNALNLPCLGITDEELIQYIIPFLHGHPEIRTLNLCSNAIRAVGIKALAESVKIHTLDLSYNRFGDAGAQALIAFKTLRNLNVEYCEIRSKGAQAVAKLEGLHTLNLNANGIRDEGAQAIATNKDIRVLKVFLNDIENAGAKALAESNVEILDLRMNRVGDEGAMALTKSTSIYALDIRWNWILQEESVFSKALDSGLNRRLSILLCNYKTPIIEKYLKANALSYQYQIVSKMLNVPLSQLGCTPTEENFSKKHKDLPTLFHQ